jgi:TfoX/Sxy family transcriptional regulator of competence genes
MKRIKWEKPSQQLIELFDDVVPKDEGVERRKMFGYPCAFKNGNMFMGLHQENMFLRLSEEDRKEFLELDQASQFEPMPGRTMREYVVAPSWMLKNAEELKEWISKSLVYVSTLPVKLKKRER